MFNRRVSGTNPLFAPIFYMGWIVQPALDGFHVYDREDSTGTKSRFVFNTLEEAEEFIERRVTRE